LIYFQGRLPGSLRGRDYQAAAGKPKARARKGKRKAAKKRAAKAVAKATPKSPESPPPPAREKAPVKATVKEVMADGQLMAGEVIVQKVQEKIGENAKSFTIYGILKNEKDFEKVGEEFRLRTAVKEEAQATSA
jgi:sRNA-binding protein